MSLTAGARPCRPLGHTRLSDERRPLSIAPPPGPPWAGEWIQQTGRVQTVEYHSAHARGRGRARRADAGPPPPSPAPSSVTPTRLLPGSHSNAQLGPGVGFRTAQADAQRGPATTGVVGLSPRPGQPPPAVLCSSAQQCPPSTGTLERGVPRLCRGPWRSLPRRKPLHPQSARGRACGTARRVMSRLAR